MSQSDSLSSNHRKGNLTSPTFLGFLLTQFLGAMNDNMFRWLVVPIAKFVADEQLRGSWVEQLLSSSGISQQIQFEPIILGAGLACFVVPYLLLASYAGYFADRFSKRKVIIGCKIAEIVIMSLGVAAIWWGSIYGMFAVVALMGSQSAIFGPAKMGVIPEIVRSEKLSAANGLVGLTTVVAVVAGTIAGGYLFSVTGNDGRDALWISALALIGVATVGWLTSMLIARVPTANGSRKFPTNPFIDTIRDLRMLRISRPILRVALGIAFFWSVAAMTQLNVDTFVIKLLHREQTEVVKLLGVLSLGVGVGSVLAGLWSGGKVELGIVPLGAALIAVSSLLCPLAVDSEHSVLWFGLLLFLLGAGGGLFNIPLMAYLQHHSPTESRGSILAASNFVTFSGMLVVSFLFPVLQSGLQLDAATVFLIAGIATIPVALYVVFLIPQATIRFIVWLASHTVYRVRVHGREHLPEEGGALLVANHVSWIDGVLLLIASSRPIRILAYADYVKGFGIDWLCRTFGVIPIKSGRGARSVMRALKTAKQAVIDGELVCIFAEGTITRTGQLQPFQRGMMRVIEGTGAPVVPIYLDQLWGSIFSYDGGRLLWKRPKHWPYPVSILFGKPLKEPDDVFQVRHAVENLGVQAVSKRSTQNMVPPRQFIRRCRSSLFRKKIADSAGTELTGGRLLTATLVLKRLLERSVLAPDEKMVGVLLPPSAGGALANTTLALSKRVAVNLNYTLSNKVMQYCIDETGIKHVLTSRRFIEKKPVELKTELVFLEDLKEQTTGMDKIVSLFQAMALPASVLESMLGLKDIQPDDLLTVIFTSGSTGEPKGVMLSHSNIGSNVASADQLFHIKPDDVFIGILPFFHSFGYTILLWLPLMTDATAVYHFNPLDARQIGKLCKKHNVTIVAATPTFLKTYLKRIDKQQMMHLDLAIVGAEKMPLNLAEAFQEKFGIFPTEGFGITELSPLACANVPDHRSGSTEQSATKVGTVGRAVPNVVAKVVDLDTGEDLGPNEQGLLKIKGPNVMLGYLNNPELTAEVIEDGWYNTGDLAVIDDDGFVEITGRLSRFSKIGGEMVPHIKVEAELARIVEESNADEPEISVAVASVSDERKGERLVVFHKTLTKPVEAIVQELSDAGLPNLWIPSADSFHEVEEIPLLGTGKLDLRRLKELANETFGSGESNAA